MQRHHTAIDWIIFSLHWHLGETRLIDVFLMHAHLVTLISCQAGTENKHEVWWFWLTQTCEKGSSALQTDFGHWLLQRVRSGDWCGATKSHRPITDTTRAKMRRWVCSTSYPVISTWALSFWLYWHGKCEVEALLITWINNDRWINNEQFSGSMRQMVV